MRPTLNGASRLGLGAVQFGLDYGVTNAAGKVQPERAQEILDLAESRGIGLIDTAPLYGDSEAVLGSLGAADRFDIVTKTVKVGSAPDAADAVERALDQSLERLRTGAVHGLLLHDAGDLLGPHREAVWNRLDRIRGSGRASKIGVSVYEGHEIDRIIAEFDPDIVQLPINAIDARLEEGGQLGALSRRNVEVHARSVFLQGILLQEPARIAPKFGELRDVVARLRQSFVEAGLTVLEGLLAEVFRHPAISRVIVGVTSQDELGQIAAAADKVGNEIFEADLGRHRITDPRLLNPALWNTL